MNQLIVVGLDSDILCCMITAYRPNFEKWESNYMVRKEGK